MKHLNKFNEALINIGIDMKWLKKLRNDLNTECQTEVIDNFYNEENKRVKEVWKCRLENIDFNIAFSVISSGTSVFSRDIVRAMFYIGRVPFHTIESRTNLYKQTITVDTIMESLYKGVAKENAENAFQTSQQAFLKRLTVEDLTELLLTELTDMLNVIPKINKNKLCYNIVYNISDFNFNLNNLKPEASDEYLALITELNVINHKLKSVYDCRLHFQFETGFNTLNILIANNIID